MSGVPGVAERPGFCHHEASVWSILGQVTAMEGDSKWTRVATSGRFRRFEGLALGLYFLGCDRGVPATHSPGPAQTSAITAAAENQGPELLGSALVPQQVREPLRGVALQDMLAPYPHGRWRLAPRAALDPVRIWASHILIRHRDVTLGGVVFGPLEPLANAPSGRTRSAARELAESLAEEARASPERFAELARRSSEDPITQTTGGSLGALHGLSFLAFPQVLDAFAALRPGEISSVVETDYGFHVFQLRSPPPERSLNGSHIVIGYDEATWLRQNLARGPLPRRTRADALELATSLYERAHAAPLEFDELAMQYSEHLDAVHGGDFGAWSTEQPDAYSRELELLLKLPVFGVAPPIDTLFGIEVVQRTADRPRERFALQMIRLPFDPAAEPSEASSQSAVLTLARTLAKQLSGEPQRFAALQAAYCCAGLREQWTEHQTPTLVAFGTESLTVGAIAKEPVELGSSYVIAKRVQPEPRTPPTASERQLPAPREVDLDAVVSRTPRDLIQEQLVQVAARTERALALDGSRAEELRSATELPPEFSDDAAAEQKRLLFRALLDRVRRGLGAAGYSRYLEICREHLRAWVLEQAL